jgi:secreted trypsin-like serine protease
MRVRGGEHNLKIEHEGGVEQYVDVKRLVVHKNFDGVNSPNDIALIEVDRAFNLTKAVGTVGLATPKSKYRETGCTVVGWGYTHVVTEADQLKPKPEPMPDTPRFVQLDIIRKEECAKFGENGTVAHPSLLCAGKLEGGKSTCSGDSGGPLTCPSLPSGQPLQVGIVSGGTGCGLPNSPT